MKKVMGIILALFMIVSIAGCGYSSYNNDSYKNKTWDEMNKQEKQQTVKDINNAIKNSERAGATWY